LPALQGYRVLAALGRGPEIAAPRLAAEKKRSRLRVVGADLDGGTQPLRFAEVQMLQR